MARRDRRIASAAACLLVAAGAVDVRSSARQETAASAPIVLDFVAVDATGRPVRDLRREEIRLEVDGRPRSILTLDLVEFGSAARGAGRRVTNALPPPYASNAVVDTSTASRSFIVIVDDDSVRPGREARTQTAVSQLVDVLAPDDRVALATPRDGWRTPLTADRSILRREIGRLDGRATQQDDPECRTRFMLQALQGLLREVNAGLVGPTVLIVSGGLAGPRRDVPVASQALMPNPFRPAEGPCDLRIEDFLRVGDAAARARAHVYVVRPEDVLVDRSMLRTPTAPVDLADGLQTLAGVVDGNLLHLTASERNPLLEAAIETSAPYLIAFQPSAAERNGKTYSVAIASGRGGVSVRAIRAVVIGAAETAGAGAVQAMLKDGRAYRDLPLRAASYASRGMDAVRPVQLLAVAEPLEPSALIATAAAGLFDGQGQLVAEWRLTSPQTTPGPLVVPLAARFGTYRLRVAATDSAGRRGTVDEIVSAELVPAGPLLLSSLVLGVVDGAGFRPALQFGSEPAATASFEVYGGHAKDVSGVLEIAPRPGGPALVAVALTFAPTSDGTRLIASGALPLADLPAGDVLVRATVRAAGQPEGRVVRTLRKAR
jgi:hypothetical protein